MRRGPRSSTGCVRCKANRLKCGEEKPTCGRCRRLGLHCYRPVQPLKWSTKHERYVADPATAPTSRATVTHHADTNDQTEHYRAHDTGVDNQVIGSPLVDTASMLVAAYFRDAARIYTTYDSALNPFRSSVAKLWPSSGVLYYALQSMGAAALTSTDTQYEAIGKQLHHNATVLIKRREGCDMNEAGLLALLMLGGTAGWYGFKDLGIPLFHLFRQQLHQMIECGQFQTADRACFYQDALICWGMLLSFVSDDDLQLTSDLGRSKPGPNTVPATCIPNAWTGVAKDAQILITQVGGLVRANRRRAHQRRFTTKAAVELQESEIASALRLEKLLHTWNRPGEANVSSTLDNSTPTWHLVYLAEAYRRTALLQLYRVFPDVIQTRLRLNAVNNPRSIQFGDPTISNTICDEYLTRFALDTLEILQSIPLGSGTKDFHPFPLVACCSELRLSQGNICTSSGTDLEGFPIDYPEDGLDVPGARTMIIDRLIAFMRYLPHELLRKSIDIVKATFRRLDEDSQNSKRGAYSMGYPVYWMDVMMDNDWDIVMA